MPASIVTADPVEAFPVAALRNWAEDTRLSLGQLLANLEGTAELNPEFFELLRAATSCAAEAHRYTRELVRHLDELALTDRRPA